MCDKTFRNTQGRGSHKRYCPQRPIAPHAAPIDNGTKRSSGVELRPSSPQRQRACKTISLAQEQFAVIPEATARWEGLSPFVANGETLGVVSPEYYNGWDTLWNNCLLGLEKDINPSVEHESRFRLLRLLPPTDEPLGWNYKYFRLEKQTEGTIPKSKEWAITFARHETVFAQLIISAEPVVDATRGPAQGEQQKPKRTRSEPASPLLASRQSASDPSVAYGGAPNVETALEDASEPHALALVPSQHDDASAKLMDDQVCEVLCTGGTFLAYGILVAKDIVLTTRIYKPRPEDTLAVRFTGARGGPADVIAKGTTLSYTFLRLQQEVDIRPVSLLEDEWKLHTAQRKRGELFGSIVEEPPVRLWKYGSCSPTNDTEYHLLLDFQSSPGSPLLTGNGGVAGIICLEAPYSAIKTEHILNDLMQTQLALFRELLSDPRRAPRTQEELMMALGQADISVAVILLPQCSDCVVDPMKRAALPSTPKDQEQLGETFAILRNHHTKPISVESNNTTNFYFSICQLLRSSKRQTNKISAVVDLTVDDLFTRMLHLRGYPSSSTIDGFIRGEATVLTVTAHTIKEELFPETKELTLALGELLAILYQEHTIVICGADMGCKPLQDALRWLTPTPARPVFWVWDDSNMPSKLAPLCDSGLLQRVICTNLEKLWDRLVTYPDRRSLLRYDELLGVDLRSDLSCCEKDERTWIDIGPGYGVAMNELLSHFIQVHKPAPRVIGIDASKKYTKMWNLLPKNRRLRHSIPGDLEHYSVNNTAHLVTDVFGPCSYGTNPLDALICLGLLLAPGGQAIVVTETRRFGTNPMALANITNFFWSNLKQKVEFFLFVTKADANKVEEWNLRILVTDQRKTGKQKHTFETLRQEAEDKVGRWIASSEALWQNEFHKIVGGEFGKTKTLSPGPLKGETHATPMFVKPAPDRDGMDFIGQTLENFDLSGVPLQ